MVPNMIIILSVMLTRAAYLFVPFEGGVCMKVGPKAGIMMQGIVGHG